MYTIFNRKTKKNILEDPILLRWAIVLGDLALTEFVLLYL